MAGRVLLLALLVTVALVAAANAVPAAYAHPITIDSVPKPFASVPSTPREVSVVFSEPIEMSYSKISVLAPSGSRVDTNDPHQVGGDTATIAVTLQPNLPEGVYTVTTKVLSAVDGHVIESAFTFGIGTAPTQTPGGQTGATPSGPVMATLKTGITARQRSTEVSSEG